MKIIINGFKVLLGSLSLIVVFYGVFYFIAENEWNIISFLSVIAGVFLFIIVSGNIKKPLYFLIIPAMMAPVLVDTLIIKYEYGKGGMMCLLMFICAITTSYIIRRYYSKKQAGGTGNSRVAPAACLPVCEAQKKPSNKCVSG